MTSQASSKPVGLVLISIYTGISAVFCVFLGAGVMVLGGAVNQWMLILGFVVIMFGVFGLAATYGLWVLAAWGYSLVNAFYMISILFSFIALFFLDRTAARIIFELVGIGLDIWILTYLNKPQIKSLFHIK